MSSPMKPLLPLAVGLALGAGLARRAPPPGGAPTSKRPALRSG